VISGILPVDKPVGWTSHDVVAKVRRIAGQKQVGHAGTLDPLATGVLLVVMGDATRLSSFLMESAKVYCAEVVLGIRTVTDDAEAPILEQRDVSKLNRPQVEAALSAFIGNLDQVPPAYAAVRHGGEKLYTLARKGITVQPEPRQVVVHSIDLVSWDSPRARLRVQCGSGTYVRSLARDIGIKLGVGGYLHALRRTYNGGFGVDQCITMASLSQANSLGSYVQPPDRAVLHLPAVLLTEAQVGDVRMGRQVLLGASAAGTVRLYGPSGILVGLGAVDGESVKPLRVFGGAEVVDARRHSG
jgi:tRNA pseudouridine55 synthase